MGKQINYWLGYEEFLQIAQEALDCGCIIMKAVSEKLVSGRTLEIVTKDEHNYWFYVPEAGDLSGQTIPVEAKEICGYSSAGNAVIEAGFSFRKDESKKITRSRLFVISGYYDEQGEYIPRPECVTKIYNRLVRVVKKIAPYTELTDICYNYNEKNQCDSREYKHKEYITPEYFKLKECEHYKLTM